MNENSRKESLSPMTPFLKQVADDLCRKVGTDLSRTVVVFPNKRASLFFNEYLTSGSDRPLWSPVYRTISELFRGLSQLRVADPIETVCRLYDLYVEATGSTESLDFFYGWGEKLLSDFDDIDKNMADADRLLRNLREIKEIEKNGFLNEEQEQVLQDFFQDFSIEKNSYIRQRFIELWNNLHALYRGLNAALAAGGEAYEGALYRSVVAGLESGDTALPEGADRYVFVGFNVLDKVEERLFGYLQAHGKALFYWDYDLLYAGADSHFEAGTFLRANLQNFPNELPSACFDNLRRGKELEFVSAPTENAQARAVTPWLRTHLTPDEKQTAIVLCNETLLQPVLHALPPEVREVNVTKGFPLHHTPAYTLVETCFNEICGNGQAVGTQDGTPTVEDALERLLHEVGIAARAHGHTAGTLPGGTPPSGHGQAAKPQAATEKFERTLYEEAYFLTYTVLNRFRAIAARGHLAVGLPTLRRLLRQVLKGTSIPFSGEPAAGLQVMGVLETRNLDFENVLMLSVNEGNLPQRVSDNSFIPYNLRREFGLTTSRHKTAVFAYYFYRLIQRASHVRMVYNCSADGMVKGEMSRFMTQILVETQLPVRHFALTSRQALPSSALPQIAKPADLPRMLAALSPSAINTYLRCQLMFYFQRVARLKEPDAPVDVIEPNTFGTIFHRAAELIYSEKLTERGALITADTLSRFTQEGGDERLAAYVARAFEDSGTSFNIIVAEVVKSYLRQLIRHDLQLVPFVVAGTETETELPLTVPYRAGGTVEVKLKGNIDRLDIVEHEGLTRLRVVDYKTGGSPESPANLEQLFRPAENHPHYVLQAFLYSLTLVGKARYPIAPALFFVHKAAGEDYTPYIYMGEGKEKKSVLHFQELAAEFKDRLTDLIAEILDPEKPFAPTPYTRFCETCPFLTLCKK